MGRCSVGPSVGLTLPLVQTDSLGRIAADEFRAGTLDLIEDTASPEDSDECWNDDGVSDA